MSVAQGLQTYLNNTKQDKTVEAFQKQYIELLKEGLIQRKGYNLAEVNVIGDKVPTLQTCSKAEVGTFK
jgi:hypothetical protein